MNQFKHILYVSEPAVAQETAFARAVSLAVKNQARLTVIDVMSPPPISVHLPPEAPGSAELKANLVAERYNALQSLTEPYSQDNQITLTVVEGKCFLEVIRTVLREGHDLVIKPAENPDFMERLFGSDDMHLLRKCPCPVWLIKADEKPDYRCIMAALDFDPEEPASAEQGPNRQIIEFATSLAIADFADLHFVHAWDAPGEMLFQVWSDNPEKSSLNYTEGERARHQSILDSLDRKIHARVGDEAYNYLSPQFHLRQGPAPRVIPDMATQLKANLVVMGTLGRTGISGLIIGNTAEAILDQLTCSVLAIKPPGFVSPVTVEE
ncbi:universal stress protein [uncultured Porticoccus sp.]|mgnify:FL=1|uniref:universal stress protein n=1 Tax=uncultured Porticoccus sp. TaxID=1256050 RepID=UPI0030DB3A3E|tara:strand:- start:9904 stop:10872 length:969 start_codon:yes stop_codon:yes gene_type:complete